MYILYTFQCWSGKLRSLKMKDCCQETIENIDFSSITYRTSSGSENFFVDINSMVKFFGKKEHFFSFVICLVTRRGNFKAAGAPCTNRCRRVRGDFGIYQAATYLQLFHDYVAIPMHYG